MRISRFAITLAVAAFAIVPRAFAVQDTPFSANGVEAVCTGVGSAKDNPAWRGYPTRLVFSNGGGEFVAAVHVALKRGARTVLETDCDAPWLLIKAPAGRYGVQATVAGGQSARADFTTGPGAQKTVDIAFPGKH